MTLVIVWAPSKLSFVHIFFFFIQLTLFSLFTGLTYNDVTTMTMTTATTTTTTTTTIAP
jgi:hypothetical protein